MDIFSYDPNVPAQKKEWKKEFKEFLIEYYRPSLVNADKVFKAIGNVNNHIKKHQGLDDLLHIKDATIVTEIKSRMLSYRAFAFGTGIGNDDPKILVLDRYIEFLNGKLNNQQSQPQISQVETTASSSSKGESPSEDEIEKTTEGLLKEVTFFRRKRNRTIRDACARRDNYTCRVCGMNFEHVYGERGKNFIEVHHLKPISSYEGEHDIPLEDLCALCSNCHSMIHLGKRILSIDELKGLYRISFQHL